MMDRAHDAELRRAHRMPSGRLVGRIHGDVNRRFADGELVNTSPIVEELDDSHFRTRSGTVYWVSSWA